MVWNIWSRWRERRRSLGPYPQNASGPFYVENGQCIACGTPKSVAPDLIYFDPESTTVDHCYFKKQPESPDEITRAIKAVSFCCCGSYRYAGNDKEIKRRLKAAGCGDSIDHL